MPAQHIPLPKIIWDLLRGREERVKGGEIVTEGDMTWGGKHVIQYTDAVL